MRVLFLLPVLVIFTWQPSLAMSCNEIEDISKKIGEQAKISLPFDVGAPRWCEASKRMYFFSKKLARYRLFVKYNCDGFARSDVEADGSQIAVDMAKIGYENNCHGSVE